MEGKDIHADAEREYGVKLEEDFNKYLKEIRKKLTQEELRGKVITFLDEHKICTLATCSGNIPRSTPLRYRNKGLTIYILTEGGMKVKNIMKNPQVSVSLYGDYSGFHSVKGLQIWGKATIIAPDDRENYLEARKIMNVEEREDLKKLGVTIRPDMKIIKIDTERARYLNFTEGILNQILTVKE
jgi:nitroimidazol reductase NimA-like FMN-containing flavoprotein (pyridoxamine 5'-phosphate oxidase superfamily)